MPFVLTDESIQEFNQASLCGEFELYEPDRKPYHVEVQKWFNLYQCMPPLPSTLLGYVIMHPEIELRNPNIYAYPQDCNQSYLALEGCEKNNASYFAIQAPILGYLVGFILLQTAQILACTTQRERALNPASTPEARILWNISFTQYKLSCPPFGTVVNALANTTYSSTAAVTYALLGSQMYGLIPNLHTALDIAATHAVGGAVIPSTIHSIYTIYDICLNGRIRWCPPSNSHKINQANEHALSDEEEQVFYAELVDPEAPVSETNNNALLFRQILLHGTPASAASPQHYLEQAEQPQALPEMLHLANNYTIS